MKEEVFVDPQIKQLFEDHDFSREFNCADRTFWKALESVCRNCLGDEKADTILVTL
jgi:hypothetical protein